jgi:hypothetical protein
MDEPDAAVVRPRPMDLPLGRGAEHVRRRIEALERLLEHSVPLPGSKRSVGLDAIVGLIPVAGDVFGAAMGAYLIFEASLLGVPKWKLLRMAGNVAFDTALGAIPLVGDVFDFVFQSNSRNLKIIKRHLARHHPLIEQ